MFEKYPLISVIIPVFNREHFIKESILSVLNQTYKNFEIIVYDDGSTDNTGKVIKRIAELYKNANLKYFYSHKNHGPSYARNRAFEASKGEFIAFLDSDDLWLKNKLKIQIKYMLENDWDICQTEEIWIRNNKRVNPHLKHKKYAGFIFDKALKLCIVSPSCVMMKRKIFQESGGFDENMPACEDYDLWLRISLKHPIYLIDKKLVIKRGGHNDQLSKTIPCLDKYRIYSIYKILKNNELTNEQRNIAINELMHKCLIYISGLKKRGKFDEAEKYERIIQYYSKEIH